jgi:hypothetical protein
VSKKGQQLAAATEGRVKRAAVVGMSGIQKVIAMAVSEIHIADDIDAAKDWLVGQTGG